VAKAARRKHKKARVKEMFTVDLDIDDWDMGWGRVP
jgi:hypothetical protein